MFKTILAMNAKRMWLLGALCGLVVLAACGGGKTLPTPAVTLSPALVGQPLKGSLPGVYRVMEDGAIRHVVDWPTFLALGYGADHIVDVPDESLAAYPLGQPLTRWLLAASDAQLYWLDAGERFPIPNLDVLHALGGDVQRLSLVSDETLAQFPLASEPLDTTDLPEDRAEAPAITAVLGAGDALWVADASGALVRYDVETGQRRVIAFPGNPTVTALALLGDVMYAGTDAGDLWRLTQDGDAELVEEGPPGRVTAIAADDEQRIWYAHASQIRPDLGVDIGAGLIARGPDGERVFNFEPGRGDNDPARHISALAFDPEHGALWAGTDFAGVLRYDLDAGAWQSFNALNGGPADHTITDLKLGPDGVVWAATGFALYRFQDGVWEKQPLAEDVMRAGVGARALAIAPDNTVYAAGDHFLANRPPGQSWQIVSGFDHPALADRFEFVTLDDQNRPWFFGREHILHRNGSTWTAYDRQMNAVGEFTSGQPWRA